MQMRNFFCAVLLLFVFVTVSKADPITLNVTSWGYIASNVTGSSQFSINAVDANGKTLRITYNSISNGALTGSVTDRQGFVRGLPYTSSTSLIEVLSGNSAGSSPATVLFMLTGTIPQVNIGVSQATSPFAMNGSISGAGQSLSFNLLLGTATIFYTSFTGIANSISIVGTGGTVTLDVPNSPIPEPTTLLLLGSGLAALGLKVRQRKQSSFTNQ